MAQKEKGPGDNRSDLEIRIASLEAQLEARRKELHCMQRLADLMDNDGQSVEYVAQGVLELITHSMRYPGIACARVMLDGKIFTTANFKETEWEMSGSIVAGGEHLGVVEVCYLEAQPDMDEIQFLTEERSFLNVVAERLGRFIEDFRVQEGLRESERRLSDIINFLPDATFAIDREGTVVIWNRAIEELTGIKAVDMVGKGNFEYALPFYGTRRDMLIDMIIKPYEEVKTQYPSVSRKGDYLIAEIDVPFSIRGKKLFLWGKASPIHDHLGNIVGAIESIRNITDRKHAEEKLQRAHDDLEARVAERTSKLSDALTALRQQSQTILELSTPVIKIWDGIVFLPLVGIVDTRRAGQVIENLLAAIVENEAQVVLLDVTGVPIIDTGVAKNLLDTVTASRMLGADVVVTGISTDAAQTITKLDIDLRQIKTRGTLRAGLVESFRLVGSRIAPV